MSIEMLLGLKEIDAEELQKLTNAPNFLVAVERAIQFTLMHDKDSVQEALKS